MPGIQGLLRWSPTEFYGTPFLSRPGDLSTAKSLRKVHPDRFDQYLTNPIGDGILIIEVKVSACGKGFYGKEKQEVGSGVGACSEAAGNVTGRPPLGRVNKRALQRIPERSLDSA